MLGREALRDEPAVMFGAADDFGAVAMDDERDSHGRLLSTGQNALHVLEPGAYAPADALGAEVVPDGLHGGPRDPRTELLIVHHLAHQRRGVLDVRISPDLSGPVDAEIPFDPHEPEIDRTESCPDA